MIFIYDSFLCLVQLFKCIFLCSQRHFTFLLMSDVMVFSGTCSSICVWFFLWFSCVAGSPTRVHRHSNTMKVTMQMMVNGVWKPPDLEGVGGSVSGNYLMDGFRNRHVSGTKMMLGLTFFRLISLIWHHLMVAVAAEIVHAYLNIISCTVLAAASSSGSLCFLRRDSLNHVRSVVLVVFFWYFLLILLDLDCFPVLFCFVFLLEIFISRMIKGSDLCTLVRLEYRPAFESINITGQHLLCCLREYCWLCNVVPTLMNLIPIVTHF